MSEHNTQTTQWDEGQIWVKICHNATRKLLALLLSRNNEKKLHVSTTELDLSSGEPLDYGPRFVKPFPRDEMRESVKNSTLWDKFNVHGIYIDDTPELYRFRRWHISRHLIGILHATLHDIFGYSLPGRIPDEENRLGSVYRNQNQWKLECWTNPKDKSNPHINAYVGDAQPHRVGRLNSGEVSLAYGLIAQRRIEEGFNDHRYIPITMFSMSCFTVRVLQMWHDKQNPKALQVRSSPIMDFEGGVENNMDDWINILCWMAGEPVGDTKNGTEVVQAIDWDD